MRWHSNPHTSLREAMQLGKAHMHLGGGSTDDKQLVTVSWQYSTFWGVIFRLQIQQSGLPFRVLHPRTMQVVFRASGGS